MVTLGQPRQSALKARPKYPCSTISRHNSAHHLPCAALDSSSQLQTQTLRVIFNIPYRCNFGQQVCLVGQGENLGNWDVQAAVAMSWQEGDVWMAELQLNEPSFDAVEYKYIIRNPDGRVAVWKPGDNCQLRVPANGEAPSKVRVQDAWDGSHQVVELLESAFALDMEEPVPTTDADQHAAAATDGTAEQPAVDTHTAHEPVTECHTAEEPVAEIHTTEKLVVESTVELVAEFHNAEEHAHETNTAGGAAVQDAAAESKLEGTAGEQVQAAAQNGLDRNASQQQTALAGYEQALQPLVHSAYQTLSDQIDASLNLLQTMDPADPAVLKADVMVARSARRALSLTTALELMAVETRLAASLNAAAQQE